MYEGLYYVECILNLAPSTGPATFAIVPDNGSGNISVGADQAGGQYKVAGIIWMPVGDTVSIVNVSDVPIDLIATTGRTETSGRINIFKFADDVPI